MSGDWPDYELLDFGEGRRLERFGDGGHGVGQLSEVLADGVSVCVAGGEKGGEGGEARPSDARRGEARRDAT